MNLHKPGERAIEGSLHLFRKGAPRQLLVSEMIAQTLAAVSLPLAPRVGAGTIA